MADVVVGEDIGFQSDIPTFQLVLPESPHIQSHVNIDSAIVMAEGDLQFFIQLFPVLPQISVHNVDHLLNYYQAVPRESCNDVFG